MGYKYIKVCSKKLNLTTVEARKIGISKTTLFYIKRNILRGKEIRLRRKTIEKLIKYISE